MPSVSDYASLLRKLFPVGMAWPDDRESTLGSLIKGVAEEPARIDDRAMTLLVESDPRTTTELLPEWEQEYGTANDECIGSLGTVQARRDAVVSRRSQLGGQSPTYFIGLAASVGFEVTITEFLPAGIGSEIGDDLWDEPWAFTWRVNAPETTVRMAEIGWGIGDPLAAWGNDLLECVIKRVQPAHTVLMFAYGG